MKKNVSVLFRCSEEMKADIDAISEQTSLTTSGVVRRALSEYLQKVRATRSVTSEVILPSMVKEEKATYEGNPRKKETR